MARQGSHRPRFEALEDRLLLSGSVPALSSLPGAPATLFLDFDGHYEAEWVGYTSVSTPAYDIDGNAAAFSAAELDHITRIWAAVAEDYSPFNLNVTTVEPPSFDNGVALCVAIGGNSAWAGGAFGGLSFINTFTNNLANTVYIFSENLGGDPRTIADAASHEAGHAFGLAHQRLWNGSTKISEYQTGPGDGTAPVMGDSYAATRSLWWCGTTTSATTYQNDMEVIAGAANGFGYRPDDHGNSAGTAATPTVDAAGFFTAGGVIEQMGDVDYFRFSSPGGAFTFRVTVAEMNNLDARLELRDAGGNLLAAANPGSSFYVALTSTIPAGDYFLVVGSAGASAGASGGNYGFNVGAYTVSAGVADPWAAASLGLPWVGTRNNASFATAKKLTLDATAGVGLVTNLHNVENVDYFKLKMPAGTSGVATITMNSHDLSVLMPKLSVYNASFVRMAKANGGPGGAVTLTVTGLKPGKVYYIVADGPRGGAFGKGSYRLNVEIGLGVPGAASTTSASGGLAAALAFTEGTRSTHEESAPGNPVHHLPALRILSAVNDAFHFHAPIKRGVEAFREYGRSECIARRSGRRSGSAQKETRLLARAGLLRCVDC